MEQNFQTSFIPKKPIIEQKVSVSGKRPTSITLIVSIFIFLVMILVSGGAYFYKETLSKSIVQKRSNLSLAKNRFEPENIAKLKKLDNRLEMSNEVLSNHVALSTVFDLIEPIIPKTVQYTSFNCTLDDTSGNAKVEMTGTAVGYRSVALQADMFSKNKNIINPIFSNFSLDEKGNVLFKLSFMVDKSFINYKQTKKAEGTITAGNQNASTVEGTSNTGANIPISSNGTISNNESVVSGNTTTN